MNVGTVSPKDRIWTNQISRENTHHALRLCETGDATSLHRVMGAWDRVHTVSHSVTQCHTVSLSVLLAVVFGHTVMVRAVSYSILHSATLHAVSCSIL